MHTSAGRIEEASQPKSALPPTLETLWNRSCPQPLATILDSISDQLGVWSCHRHAELPDSIFLAGKICGDPEPDIEIERTVNFEDKFIVHDGVIISPEGKRYGRILLKNSFAVYEKFGFRLVKVKAGMDIGPYVWGRFGFLPTDKSWEELRERVSRNLERYSASIPEDTFQGLLEDIEALGPKALWLLVDERLEIDGKKLGLRLLEGGGWEGFFNFDDPAAVYRFNQYVSAEK